MKETWQERLKRFEATPPPQVWDHVEESLEQDPASVAERLLSYEAAPPAGLWNRIEQQLETVPAEETTPVIALPPRRNTFYSYMAAAAVLFAVLVGTAVLLNRRPAEAPVAARTTLTPAPAATPLHTAEPTGETIANNPVTISAPEVETLPTGIGKNRNARTTTGSGKTGFGTPPASSRDVYAVAHPGAGAPAAASASLDEDRYLVRSYNNGNTVRFSKKVSAVVDCAEHSTGFTQSLCKVSIGAVQEKLASAVTTDFGGLIASLQDLEKTK